MHIEGYFWKEQYDFKAFIDPILNELVQYINFSLILFPHFWQTKGVEFWRLLELQLHRRAVCALYARLFIGQASSITPEDQMISLESTLHILSSIW